VIVTNPPAVGALVTYASARLWGAEVVLDSHPGAFGAQGDRIAARLQRLNRWLTRRARLSFVTDETWRDVVQRWGGRAVIVHEAPGRWEETPLNRGERLEVLCVGRFAPDEPVADVFAAARATPEVDVLVTGDIDVCPAELLASAPPNVRFTGFLDPGPYRAAVESCDAILALTTEPSSVMRAAYEAVYAGRPLIVSDWPVARELFPYAVHTPNDAAGLASALRRADARYVELTATTSEARRLQVHRWGEQLQTIRDALADLVPSRPGSGRSAQSSAHRSPPPPRRRRAGVRATITASARKDHDAT
jgi:glycosyltransferase involved in cell wall biosynthesis